MTPDCIRVDGVYKTYRDGSRVVDALADITFKVCSGELVCIVGPSGCGKSTLLRILAKLEEPTDGTAWIDSAHLREGVAYVQQASALLPWRTLLQNASLGREVRDKALNPVRVENILQMIHKYGLDGFENSFPSELSGGMAQKVALICALQSRPRVLLCDEPFSAVDFVTRLELNTLFKNMCRLEAITTIFVTHNIEEAIFLGDRVIVMSGRPGPGRIVKTHTPYLSIAPYDAVLCRQSPEFSEYFLEIWADLRGSHDDGS